MDRRDLLKLITAATGMALIGAKAMAEPAQYPAIMPEFVLTPAERATLDEIAEVIIPRTETPGAKDAKVAEFMEVFVRDCYNGFQRTVFRNGISAVNRMADERFGGSFVRIAPHQRAEIIGELDMAAKTFREAGPNPHFYTMFKQLTLMGFFTSEVGAKEALEYVAVPGRYDGDMLLEPDQRAWAT